MSQALKVRAEITKLARLLGVEPESLDYLEKVASDDVRLLRERATDMLFDSDRHLIERLAAGSRILPVSVLASIGERVFGPLLCARVAGALDPGRAVDVAGRLSPLFLADVSVELDPRRAADVIGRVPAAQVAGVAAELVRRDEQVTMGRFVAYLSDEAIRAALEVIDDASLIRIAFVLEAKERLDHVVGLVPAERLPDVIAAAATGDLWPEVLDLLASVGAERRSELANLAAQQDESIVNALVTSAHEQGLWDSVLPLTTVMSQDSLRRFAGAEAIQDAAVLDGVVGAATRHDLWQDLLPLVPLLAPASRVHVAAAAAALPRAQLERLVASARDHEAWPAIAALVAEFDGDAGLAPLRELLEGA